MQIEPAVVLGALGGFANDQLIGKVGIAVRANTIGRIKPHFDITHEGEGFFP